MKINEMIKKISNFNEVAEMIGAQKTELKVKIGFSHSVLVGDMKSFRKHIKDEYIDCVADAILAYGDYSFDRATEISAIDALGTTFTETVEFFVVSQ